MTIGTKIRQLRVANKLSQSKVAIAIGMTQPNYSNIESDVTSPKPETLDRIAEFYKIDVNDLKSEEFDIKSMQQYIHNYQTYNQTIANTIIKKEPSFENERKLFEQLLESKDTIISQLQQENAFLKELVKK